MTKSQGTPHHKRHLRNYLLDAGLQLRYTLFIIAVTVFLTAILGSRIYVAARETTRIVTLTAVADPSTEREMQQQFRERDHIILWTIAGFGLVLSLTVTAAGIWMTHKIAGPLHNIGSGFARIRDNKLPEDLRHLRKGDQLKAFHASFKEMYDAVRARAVVDKDVLDKAIEAIEGQPRTAEIEAVLEDLRRLRDDKAASLRAQEN